MVEIIKSENLKTSNWGGGFTTELFIYPRTAEYKLRDFKFRLSTATVEIEESTFTPLPGISRTLMVLDGEMTLKHKDHHTIKLNKLQKDHFEGNWKTTSVGKCSDFNLMVIGEMNSELTGAMVKKGERQIFENRTSWDWNFLYLYRGECKVLINNKAYTLSKGDLLTINELPEFSGQVEGLENSELVFCKISQKVP